MTAHRSQIVAAFAFALLTLVGAAAGRQLAMRVEVRPLVAADEGVLSEVLVWIAPEDRGALGSDAMVWLELSRQGVRVLRRGWAVKVDDPSGPLRVELVLPEGEAVLRVDVKGSADRSEGVWWGDVNVAEPEAGTVAVAEAVAEAETEAVAEAETEAVAETETEAVAETVAEAEAVAETVAVTEIVAETVVETETVAVAETVAEAEAVAETVAVAEAGAETVTDTETAAVTGAETETTADAPREPGPTAMPTAAATPHVAGASTPTTTAPVLVVADELREPQVSSGFGELTVAVTRDGQPVTGLAAHDLELRAGRDTIVVRWVRGAGEAPLRLGFVADLMPESAPELPWIGRMVAELARRAEGVGGAVFVTSRGGASSGWREPASELAEMVVAVEDHSGLADGLVDSLAAFSTFRGRVFLVLVSDGRSDRSGWKDALQAAQRAGVPVLVAGIWHADFGTGARRDLRKLADVSGGALFYVQGPTQVEDLLGRFGTAIDGSHAVSVDAPPGTTGVAVSAVDASLTVQAATAVR